MELSQIPPRSVDNSMRCSQILSYCVLQSVLPMLPTNSLLAQSYTNSLDSHVIFHTELESNWTSCLMTLIGHSDLAQALAPSPDGGLLASASSDKTIKLQDPLKGLDLRPQDGEYARQPSERQSPHRD